MRRIGGVVLVGGGSTRLEFDGETLVHAAVRTFEFPDGALALDSPENLLVWRARAKD